MRRQDIPEYPEVALREVLVNAVAHADYSLTGMRIRVAIYADHLEVENPGMLPFGMTLDDLKAGVSRIRNRVIVRVLRELGLVEEWGTGYRRVMQTCDEGGYPPPTWQELSSALRVIFQPHPEAADEDSELNDAPDVPINEPDVPANVPDVPINEPISERQRWLLVQLSEGQQLKPHDVTAHFGIAEKTAKRDIADLKARGLIEFVGARKTGFYRLKK